MEKFINSPTGSLHSHLNVVCLSHLRLLQDGQAAAEDVAEAVALAAVSVAGALAVAQAAGVAAAQVVTLA